MTKQSKIIVQGKEIILFQQNEEDYISLTDIAKYKNPEHTEIIISNWMSRRYSIEFMGIWEKFHILILMLSNSITLKMKVDQMLLFCLLKNG